MRIISLEEDVSSILLYATFFIADALKYFSDLQVNIFRPNEQQTMDRINRTIRIGSRSGGRGITRDNRTSVSLPSINPHRDIEVDGRMNEGKLMEFKRRYTSGERNFSGINLEGADLARINLWGAKLTGGKLAQINLFKSILCEADLEGADLTRANLRMVNLNNANLANANLSGASLTGADLSQTNLSGANLTGALLGEASLWKAKLDGAKLNKAFMPNGKKKGLLTNLKKFTG